MARFQVLAGGHAIGNKAKGTQKVYKKNGPHGDIFETDTEKQTQFCKKYPDKYKLVEEPVNFSRRTPSPTQKDVEEVEIDMGKLDSMTVAELNNFAREYDINTHGLKKRDELLKQIKSELERMGKENE